jgi:hypothetical protein
MLNNRPGFPMERMVLNCLAEQFGQCMNASQVDIASMRCRSASITLRLSSVSIQQISPQPPAWHPEKKGILWLSKQ